MKKDIEEKIEEGIKKVASTLKKGKVLLGSESRYSKDRRKQKVVIDRKRTPCRYLVIKDEGSRIGYCEFHKHDLILPGACRRCSDFQAKEDRRTSRERRKT